VAAVRAADVRAIGGLTTRNWEGPAQGDHPVGQQPVHGVDHPRGEGRARRRLLGFLMLGGMSGGGMAFFVAPHRQAEFRREIGGIMARVKAALDDALPFAMEPVVYDFRINPLGSFAELQTGADAMMPARYYTLQVPRMIAEGSATLDSLRKSDVDHFANHCQDNAELLLRVFRTMINNLFPVDALGCRHRRRRLGCRRRAHSRRERLRPGCSMPSFVKTSSAGGSAWPGTACRSIPTSATSRTPT